MTQSILNKKREKKAQDEVSKSPSPKPKSKRPKLGVFKRHRYDHIKSRVYLKSNLDKRL